MEIRKLDIAGKTYTIETGRIAKQASGSVLVSCGDTMVLVTACLGGSRGADFLPLTIDYVEKTYAAGKIPGGFYKREGKLSDRETLTSRIIDRPLRPLFPKGFNNEVQIIATVLSADKENAPDILALIGASAALTISEMPFAGPVAAVRVGKVNGELVINPSYEQLESSEMDIMVAGTRDALVMVEGGAAEVPEEGILEALYAAHEHMQPLIDVQHDLAKAVGKEKIEFVPPQPSAELVEKVKGFLGDKVKDVVTVKDKLERKKALSSLREELFETVLTEDAEEGADNFIGSLFDKAISEAVRNRVFDDGTRIDGRDTTTVRDISIDLGLLPRAHGSSLFTRGETQSIVVVTLGTENEAQRVETLVSDSSKNFMLHYNFPPFCVGETRPLRGPGRREIGHGTLAERAVSAVMPEAGTFPYVVRIVSEITESNGSSSMATVCGSSLALMQAGVPIKAAVAGVAMGLLKDDTNDRFAVLTDILGDEDHLGDMDFKVCGTEKGITALQMDIKVNGLTKEIMTKALTQAYDARQHILGKMTEAIKDPADEMSSYAPRIVSIKVNPDKIRDIIGPGGKTIRSITESCGVRIEVEDNGTVNISSADDSSLNAAIEVIEGLTREVILGKLYEGVVKRVVDFGAFVEVIPGTDGLVHISQLADQRVNKVEDVVREGDIVWVKVLDIDRQGKVRLSMKEAAKEMSKAEDSKEKTQEG